MASKTRSPRNSAREKTRSRTSRPKGASSAATPAAVAATLAMLGLLGVSARAQETPAPVPPPGTPAPGIPTTPPAEPLPAPTPAPAEPAPASAPEETKPKAEDKAKGDEKAAKEKETGKAEEAKKKDGKTDAKPADAKGEAAAQKANEKPADQPVTTNGSAGNGASILGKLGENLTFSGGTTFSMRSHKISGGGEGSRGYLDDYGNAYDTRRVGPFQQTMDLTVQGKFLNVFNVDARFSNSRYGNYLNNTIGLNFKKNGTSLELGNVSASLTGNSLVSFSKSLQGIVLSRDFGGGKIRTTNILSVTKAVTRRGTFQGNGTSGPYYLGGSSILEGTERLRLDGRELRRGSDASDDYLIDYFTGQVTFNRIIPPESTVEYSYESQNYNGNAGLLFGSRWDFSTGMGNFGLTWLQQKAKNPSGRNGTTVERFPVHPDPLYRYGLLSRVEPGTPVRVWWKELELVENIDFELNRQLRFIRLIQPKPADTSLTGEISLRVEYTPVRSSSLGGDRTVMGVDGNMRLGSRGNLNVQFGQSKAASADQTGNAMTVTASLEGGSSGRNNWTLTTVLRDIGAGFSGVDSVSSAFLRAEKGMNTNFSFSPNQYINLNTSFTNSRLAQQNFGYFGNENDDDILTWVNNSTWNMGLDVKLPNLPSLSFQHSQVQQNGASRSTFMTDSLTLGWQRGILGISAGLTRTASKGRSVFSNGYNYGGYNPYAGEQQNNPSLTLNDSSSDSARLNISLTPAAWLSFTGNVGFTNTQFGSTSGQTSTGSAARARDLGGALTLRPGGSLSIQASFSDTSNGQSTAGFYNSGGSMNTDTGLPIGVPGIGGGSGITLTGQRTKTSQLSVQYTPFSTLTLDFSTDRQLYLIPGYDNTESGNSQVAFSFSGLSKFQISGSLSDQKVNYVGGQGDSNSRSYQLTGSAGPFGALTLTSSLQRLNTGSNLFYSTSNPRQNVAGSYILQNQNLTVFTTRGDFEVGGGRTLFVQLQNIDTRTPKFSTDLPTGGYRVSPNSQRSVGTAGIAFKITPITTLTFDTNIIRMNDRDDPDYSYRARTVNMDLAARF